ncbi:MAG TPA: acylphosphatase [Devosiaceae bacterium]|jgi:acylphosphatase|nr:acylphosphatase [Devosiaceae bacterium]
MAGRTVHLSITGRVQGVGFRDWLAAEARAHELSGWVRNRRDGSVEAVLAGDAEALQTVLAACRRGPPMARVEDVVAEEDTASPEPGFAVRPTA